MTLLIYSRYQKRHCSQSININDLHQQSLINDLKTGLSTNFFIVLRIGIDKVIYKATICCRNMCLQYKYTLIIYES